MIESQIPTPTLNGFRIIEQLSENYRSIVYRTIRSRDNLAAIVKILQSEGACAGDFSRYKQEYEIYRLNLEGVVQTYGLQKYNQAIALILEDFGGKSLKQLIKNRALTQGEFLTLAIQIAEALGSIHSANIIHKDINPEHILFNPETEEVKLIGFSIATIVSQENPPLKNPNLLEGTLAYMSPEQTGRMNRTLDYRTDFYSLGVTLYELLLNQLPFTSPDPMELVHSHLAKQPIPPHQIDPSIPKVISDLVMKLLSKTAEDRYQSAWGLQADLVICLMQLDATGEIEDFILGENDICRKFNISPKFYGRQAQINTLGAAFERTLTSQRELMLIVGESGIGKTALVQQLESPIAKKNGYFISGKFDKNQQDIPYSGWIKAFEELVAHLLMEPDDRLHRWQEQLRIGLGNNGQVIVDVIPEMELISGKQPPINNLPPAEAETRFDLTFQNFIKVFAHPHHPLTLFLDDIQWADAASLRLIERLMSVADPGLFLILSYREGESPLPFRDATPPVLERLAQIEQTGGIVHRLELEPLNLASINQLLADTFQCSLRQAGPLAGLVMDKTGGNPFFIQEFLTALYDDGLIEFDNKSLAWQWSIKKIKRRGITDNVVQLLAGKIRKLGEQEQSVLKLAACIGKRFDLQTLAAISQQSVKETATNLRAGVTQGFILPATESADWSEAIAEWKAGTNQEANLDCLIAHYKFVHDRIHAAAYSLIPDATKSALHLIIGQYWLQRTSCDRRDEFLFEIVNQLNQGISPNNSPEDRENIAQLNLSAGQKAKRSSAYQTALKYLNQGIQLLGDNRWQTHYDLTLALYQEATEAAYLCGDFQQLNALAHPVIESSKTLLDTVKIYDFKIQARMAQSQQLEALEIGVNIAKQLGIHLMDHPTPGDIQRELEKTQAAMADQDPNDLLALPLMRAPEKLAAMRILSSLVSAAYQAAPSLLPLIVFEQVNLSIQFGNSPWSAFAYATYGVILSGVFGEIELGYKFGQLAVNLLSQFNLTPAHAKILTMVEGLINPWRVHLKDTLIPLQEAERRGIENGDLEWASYAAKNRCQNLYFIGQELTEVEQEMAVLSHSLNQWQQMNVVQWNKIYRQAVLNLLGRSENPCQLVGEAYNRQETLPLMIIANDRNGLHDYFVNQLMLCYWFENYAEALVNAEEAQNYLDGAIALPVVALFYWYDSLTRIALCDRTQEQECKILLKKVATNQKKLKTWADHAPMNYLHKCYLVQAEKDRILGHKLQAMDGYDLAIQLATEQEYVQEAALANELAAKFYLGLGKLTPAKAYMQEAREGYKKWGAMAKVQHLESSYSHLLPVAPEQFHTTNGQKPTPGGVSVSRESSDRLDLTTVLKASQAIASEIVLDKLLATLMKTALENAGAEKAFLILAVEGKLLISASASTAADAVTVEQSIDIENCSDLPVAIVKYVARTGSNLVLSNAASEGAFTKEPYVVAHQLKSLLCTPIVNGGKTLGILYLENNLTQGAFTQDRLEILKILSSQAAIALENALLYAHLEAKVQERTQALNQANDALNEKNLRLSQTLETLKHTQAQLIQTEKMSSLGQMVAGIAHEINNPVSFIYGNLNHAGEYLDELFNLVSLYQKHYPGSHPEIQVAIKEMDLEFLLEDLPRLLSSMKTGADRIRQIVLGLRNFSRLDESAMKEVDLHEGIDSTLLILQSRFTSKNGRPGIEVIKKYGNLPKITCYASQLNQVVMNILNNAIDAMDGFEGFQEESNEESVANSSALVTAADVMAADLHRGKTRLPRIIVRTEVSDRDWVQVRIADNGPGINEQVRLKIFDPFFTTKPVGQGTGLGLSIAYSIVVEKHGGKLRCISTPGEGTEFIISLPIQTRLRHEIEGKILGDRVRKG
ncbi:trifunctional serine/threonine-protein kinase/ATP-binding protein/sensor histidine kinase [Oscillatoria acuminata]|uniref:histidine kinase n=1 Tax=Oscillatoria acuminata PCC 6304 TaxID=56110 RepID=K9TS23_9CYAN|nr:ATP-binding sensor histidine kinase [Oscillatoria acuminata]AFY84976.1 putative ATPase [Oscillatoria acuminata PCC 6304]